MAADCPAELVCVAAVGRCPDPANGCTVVDDDGARAASDGTVCDAAGGAGRCRDGTCVAGTCSDGFVDAPAETCDLGSSNSDTIPNACRTTCTRARCGDGVVDLGEECDEDAADCVGCVRVCIDDTANCDGAPGCECSTSVVDAGANTFDALVAEDDALWLAVNDGITTRIERHPLADGAPTGPATTLAALGLGQRAFRLVVDAEAVYVAQGDVLSPVWRRLDKVTGAATTIASRSQLYLAVSDEHVAFFDDEVLVYATKDLANRVEFEALRSLDSAGCTLAFSGGELFVVDSLGELYRATLAPSPRSEMVVEFADVRALVADADGLVWLTGSDRLVNRSRDGDLQVLADMRAFAIAVTPGLVWLGSSFDRAELASVARVGGAEAHRAATAVVSVATSGDDVHWIESEADPGCSAFVGRRWRHLRATRP